MIKSQLTLKQLEAFVFVVDRGSFRGAAFALGTTQPNISARISALESAMGCVLLHRDAGSVRLTDKGRDLLAEARTVLRAAERFLDVAQRRDLIEDRLRLGVTEMIACTWLQAYLRALKAMYPAVRVELQVDLSRQIEEDLAAGQLDLSLQSGPFKTDLPGTLSVGDYPYIWVSCPELVARIGDKPDLQTLFTQPVLTHAQPTVAGDELHALVKAERLPATQVVHSNSLSACVPMAVDGMGVALLPQAILQRELDAGRLVQLAVDWVPSPLRFFARHDATRAPGFVAEAAALAVRVSQDAV